MKKLEKLKVFWEKYEKKTALFVGLILIAFISFEIGILQGHKLEQRTMIIEKAPDASNEVISALKPGVLEVKSDKSVSNLNNSQQNEEVSNNKECAFVASKNSDKYHKFDCRWAKNIKPENTVCFKSEEEAKSRGYVGDKNCVK